MAITTETRVEYIGADLSSRSIHELEGTIAYYNYEGIHFRVFSSFIDAKAFVNGELVKPIADFDSEDDLDIFFEDSEICSSCGIILWPDSECYEDIDTAESCCTGCCFFDEEANGYRKGTREAHLAQYRTVEKEK